MRSMAWLVAFLLVAACSPRSTEEALTDNEVLTDDAASSDVVMEGTAYAVDEVPIAYDVRGSGNTALVFVHCWACDRSFWREQLDAFADRYQVVALDLAGHGASGSNREDWSITGLAGDVEAVVQELGLERVILVGHSMGGPVSLAAAQRMPERVIGVACVDTLHNAEYEWDPQMAEQMVSRLEEDFEGGMGALVRQMFPQGADPEVVEWVVAKGQSTNPKAALALMKDFPNFDLKAALREADVPIRCVNAAPLPPLIPETAVEVNRQYSDYDAVIMADVSHYLMLEQPEQFNAKLRTAVAEMATP